MTGEPRDDTLTTAESLKVFAYLAKPVTKDALLDVVARAFGEGA